MMTRSKKTRTAARRCALQALYQWQMTGQSAKEIERQFLADQACSDALPDYFVGLVTGVIDHRETIDEALARFSDRPVEEIDPIERAILRLGGYELLYRWEVPYRAVLNEAVNLAKIFGATSKSFKYVNGVLDKCAHQVRAAEIHGQPSRNLSGQ